MSIEDIKADITALVKDKDCGPIFIRLSWHDAGVYSTKKLSGGEFGATRHFPFAVEPNLSHVSLSLITLYSLSIARPTTNTSF